MHYTGQQMLMMGFTSSNNCLNCQGNTPDNHIHTLWFCPPVQRFWYRICEDLSKCQKCNIPASPSVCLLGTQSCVPHGQLSLCSCVHFIAFNLFMLHLVISLSVPLFLSCFIPLCLLLKVSRVYSVVCVKLVCFPFSLCILLLPVLFW